MGLILPGIGAVDEGSQHYLSAQTQSQAQSLVGDEGASKHGLGLRTHTWHLLLFHQAPTLRALDASYSYPLSIIDGVTPSSVSDLDIVMCERCLRVLVVVEQRHLRKTLVCLLHDLRCTDGPCVLLFLPLFAGSWTVHQIVSDTSLRLLSGELVTTKNS